MTFYGHTELGAEMATEILRRLKRSRAVAERVAWLVRYHLRYTQAPKMRLSTLKRFLRGGRHRRAVGALPHRRAFIQR